MSALQEELLTLMAARRGHFLLESGHHGELWLDVDRLFVDARRARALAVALAERLADCDAEAICGPLTGGAFLAQFLAAELNLPWVYAQRVVAAPSGLFSVDYPIPPELAEFARGRRVAVVNDVINAGSAVRGAIASLRSVGAQPIVLGALLVMGNSANQMSTAAGMALEALSHLPNEIWLPDECPMCRAGRPLDA